MSMHYPNVHKLATTSAASIYCNIAILCSNPTYGILTPKQVRHNIADQLLANQMAQLQL